MRKTLLSMLALAVLLGTTGLSLAQSVKPFAVISFAGYDRMAKDLEVIGGKAYLAEVAQSVPYAANAAYYAKIVRDKATLRGLIHTSTEILRDAHAVLLDEGGGAIPWRGELPLAGLAGPLRDVVTGRLHPESTPSLAALFGDFPVALLASE